jgi:hypothetical protein
MRTIKIPTLVAAALAVTIFSLHAIPNQVGGVGFINFAGMRFENFAEQAETWKPGAKLPGKWENWQDPKNQDSGITVFRLNLTADVFGIRASQVKAQIKNGQVLRFEVVFDKRSTKSASLVNQLATNIGSFTGDRGGADSKSFNHKKINIQLRDDPDGRVVVTISPKATAVVER